MYLIKLVIFSGRGTERFMKNLIILSYFSDCVSVEYSEIKNAVCPVKAAIAPPILLRPNIINGAFLESMVLPPPVN